MGNFAPQNYYPTLNKMSAHYFSQPIFYKTPIQRTTNTMKVFISFA